MLDVIVAGAGPAGAIAALVMARAGARVLILDRSTFPRDKLCGDTINPGAVSFLRDLGLTDGPLASGHRLHGMRVTGPTASVTSRYGGDAAGIAIRRRDLDQWLLDAAIKAGARFEPRTIVRGPLFDGANGQVRGVVLATPGQSGDVRMPALMVIGADGRRSVLARLADLRAPASRIRRWAFGTYATGVAGMTDLGEMHIRPKSYCGLAPLGNDLVNICAVITPVPGTRDAMHVIREVVARDPALSQRLAHAAYVGPSHVLGPLAADVRAVGAPGLLLAGDAAGFVDPMTGDGIHLAMQGAQLAAIEAMRAIETGEFEGAVTRLAQARRRQFGAKLQFNRMLRRLVQAPSLVDLASRAARIAPSVLHRAVQYAGDVR